MATCCLSESKALISTSAVLAAWLRSALSVSLWSSARRCCSACSASTASSSTYSRGKCSSTLSHTGLNVAEARGIGGTLSTTQLANSSADGRHRSNRSGGVCQALLSNLFSLQCIVQHLQWGKGRDAMTWVTASNNLHRPACAMGHERQDLL